MNGTAKAQLKEFMEEGRSFDEYIKVTHGRLLDVQHAARIRSHPVS